MNGQRRVAPGYLALFASIYALQGVVVAYFFNYNQLFMIAGGSRAARSPRTPRAWPWFPSSSSSWAGRSPTASTSWAGDIASPTSSSGWWCSRWDSSACRWCIPGSSLAGFTALAVLTVTGLALYDTCCDGMVIDVTPPSDRDRVQGLLVASRAAAAMFCTLGFGFLLEATGNGPGRGSPVLWICAGWGHSPGSGAGLAGAPRADDAESFQWRALGVLVKPRALVLLAFGAFYALVGYGVEINLSPFYGRELQLREGAIGGLGAARYVGRVLGAALLPVLALRMGRSWILTTGLLALAASTAAQALISGPWQAALAGGAFGAANGWTDAVFYVLAMEASDPRMAASTYALFMAVTNISVAGGSLFARLASALGNAGQPGYRLAFLITGAFVLLAWPSVRPLGRTPPAT